MPQHNPNASHHKPQRREIFVARPIPDDNDIIDAVAMTPDQPPSRTRQFEKAFLGLLDHIDQHNTQNSQHAAPPPSTISPPGDHAAPGGSLGGSPDNDGPYYYGDYDDPIESIRDLLHDVIKGLGHFVFISKSPTGGLIGAFHLPMKAIAMFFFALFLMFATLYNFPNVWETVFGFFGLA